MKENKRRTVMDLQVMQRLLTFERLLTKWLDDVCDRKHRNTKGQRIERLLDDAKEECIMALGLEVAMYPIEKHHCFNKAQCRLYAVQLLLNDLNDDGIMSNDAKARLDMALDDVLIDIHRLLESMTKRIDIKGVSVELERFLSSLIDIDVASPVPVATAKGETCDLEGCLTGSDQSTQ